MEDNKDRKRYLEQNARMGYQRYRLVNTIDDNGRSFSYIYDNKLQQIIDFPAAQSEGYRRVAELNYARHSSEPVPSPTVNTKGTIREETR